MSWASGSIRVAPIAVYTLFATAGGHETSVLDCGGHCTSCQLQQLHGHGKGACFAERTAVGITRIHILSSARRGRRPNADVGRVLSGRSPFRH
jgi:hypothetical protein